MKRSIVTPSIGNGCINTVGTGMVYYDPNSGTNLIHPLPHPPPAPPPLSLDSLRLAPKQRH